MYLWTGIILCISILIVPQVINVNGTITKPGHVRPKIMLILGFITDLIYIGNETAFHATRITFCISFRPLTIKHYFKDCQIVIENYSIIFKVITKHKHFVLFVLNQYNMFPYTQITLTGKEIFPG
jgi:hypothetical protein